jgi:hypothetical protein
MIDSWQAAADPKQPFENLENLSMQVVLNIALVLSILAFIPSAAAFTPSILVSGVAALFAVVAIQRGFLRRGLLTIYFAICAFLVSPMIFDIESVDKYLVAFPVVGLVGSIVLFWHYKRSRNALS